MYRCACRLSILRVFLKELAGLEPAMQRVPTTQSSRASSIRANSLQERASQSRRDVRHFHSACSRDGTSPRQRQSFSTQSYRRESQTAPNQHTILASADNGPTIRLEEDEDSIIRDLLKGIENDTENGSVVDQPVIDSSKIVPGTGDTATTITAVKRQRRHEKTRDSNGRLLATRSPVIPDPSKQPPSILPKEKPQWLKHKETMRAKIGPGGWAPRKRLSPDSLNGIRVLHESDPELYSTPVLSAHLKISPEAIRRILKSRWQPEESEIEDRRKRWEVRGQRKRKGINEHRSRRKEVRMVRNYDTQQDIDRLQQSYH